VRRVHTRRDVELEVTLESESNFYLGFTRIFRRWALHRYPQLATHGQQGRSLAEAPHVAEPFKTVGTVRWIREFSETSDTSPGMGVRFEHIDPAQVEQIREFLNQRAPLFYDED